LRTFIPKIIFNKNTPNHILLNVIKIDPRLYDGFRVEIM